MSALHEFNRFEAQAHPKAPHWYLSGIATDPDCQRRGIASALMAPVFEHCDARSIPAFLITQTEANVPFYAGRGFVVTGQADLPKGGPHLWLMWREPRTAVG
jgi:ribosomal protein S18 acetylase RimI-like enzyme